MIMISHTPAIIAKVSIVRVLEITHPAQKNRPRREVRNHSRGYMTNTLNIIPVGVQQKGRIVKLMMRPYTRFSIRLPSRLQSRCMKRIDLITILRFKPKMQGSRDDDAFICRGGCK